MTCNPVAVGGMHPAVGDSCLSVRGMQQRPHTKVGVPVAVRSVGGMPLLPGEVLR